MEKVKNFDEYLNEGIWSHADWVDLSLLQNTIERMRNDEYKEELKKLNDRFPLETKVKINLPGSES